MALTAADIRDAAQKGKIAGIIGVEGLVLWIQQILVNYQADTD